MSDNGELILGFCPLPEAQENAVDNNEGQSPTPSPNNDAEVITGDLSEFRSVDEQADSQEEVEFKPMISHENPEENSIIVEYKPIVDEGDVKPIQLLHVASDMAGVESLNSSNTGVVPGSVSESLPASTNIVDFINRAGSELTASLDDDDESERPAKKRRKTLPKGTFQCAECRILCENYNVYTEHMNTHSEIPLYTCPKCLYIFQDKLLFNAHLAQTCKAAGNAKDKECAVCRKTFKYDSHLREHIICMHNKTPLFSCPICGQNITSWRRSIDRHMTNHANQIKCPTCGVKAESSEAVDVHVSEAGENHLRCRACDYTSNSRLEFFNHVTVHIPKVDILEPMVCYKCGHRFQRTSEFNNHVRLFCKFRDVQMLRPDAKILEPPRQATIQLPIPEGINDLDGCSTEENPEMIQVATDASKQIITLPDGMNNNAFIPVTLTTGGEDLGQGIGPNTTVIIIPQMLLMPNAGGMVQDGTGEMIGGIQNDQVIYLECIKPDQAGGMMPMFEIPADKNGQENVFANHVPQSIMQALQQLQAMQPMQGVQSLQAIQSVQAIQPVQTVQPLQALQPVEAIQQVHQVHTVEQLQQAQSTQLVQENDQAHVVSVKEEVVEEEEQEQEANAADAPPSSKVPPSPIPTSVAPLSIQNVYSLGVNSSPSGPQVEPANQHVDSGGPPALVCSVCNEVLKDSETYESHVKQHDKSKTKPKPNITVQKKGASSFKCEQCGQGFAAKHHLEQHTITFHSDVAGIVCPVCRVGMASEKTSLNEHLAKAHNLKVEPSGKLTDCSGS